MSWHHPLRRINIRESWRRAHAQFAAVVAERDTLRTEYEALAWEVDALKAELAEARALNRELRASVWARHEAWTELAALHRERQIERARQTEREPGALLH